MITIFKMVCLSPRRDNADEVEHFFEGLVVHQNGSVENAEKGVAQHEGQKIVPDQLEHAALPDHHQVDEAPATLARISITIGVNVAEHFHYLVLPNSLLL